MFFSDGINLFVHVTLSLEIVMFQLNFLQNKHTSSFNLVDLGVELDWLIHLEVFDVIPDVAGHLLIVREVGCLLREREVRKWVVLLRYIAEIRGVGQYYRGYS